MDKENIGFQPKARIILQLGDQLIRSENIRSQEYSVYELERILARQPALKKTF